MPTQVGKEVHGSRSEVGGDYLWILRKSEEGEWLLSRLIWNNDQP